MTQYNTGNPVPSSAMPDIWDNNATIDEFVNSPELTLTTRTGTERDTLAGIQKKSDDQRVQMAEDGAAVVEETRQNLIPLGRQYMTLAAAQADIANIPVGSTTYYRSPDDSALAVEVINNAGTLTATGRKMASYSFVEKLPTLGKSGDHPNLVNFDDNDLEVGKRLSVTTGLTEPLAGYNTTGWIPVTPGQQLVFSVLGEIVDFYSSSRAFLSGASQATRYVTVPTGAAWMRASYQQSSVYWIVTGTVLPASVSPFGLVVRPDRIQSVPLAALPVITPEYLRTFQRSGTNLFNKNSRLQGYYISERGTPIASAQYDASAMIKVEPGKTYTSNAFMRFVTMYGAGGTPIEEAGLTANTMTFTVPAGVTGVRVSIAVTSVDTFALAEGSTTPAYTEFKWIAPSSLPDGTPVEYMPKINDGAVSRAMIASEAVSPDKTNLFTASKNIFLADTVTDGYYVNNNTGQLAANATYSASDYIPVKPSTTYTARVKGGRGARTVAFYVNANTAIAPGVAAPAGDVYSFTTPPTATLMRVSPWTADVTLFQVQEGDTATDYEAPGFVARTEIDGIPITWPSSGAVTTDVRPSYYGLERLRETRQRLRSLKYGKTGKTARLVVGMVGDSWTHNTGRYALKVATSLWRKYHAASAFVADGPIGRGFCSFGGIGSSLPNGDVVWNNRAVIQAGTADVSAYGTGNGPDACQAVLPTGTVLRFQGNETFTKGTTFTLFAEGGAGVVRHSWDSGITWQASIDLSALTAGLQTVLLTGKPVSGVGQLWIEAVSGPVTLYGVNEVLPDVAGVLVHKLGATGTRVQQWASIDAAHWEAGIAALGLNLLGITHGTNDQTTGRSKAQYKADILTLIDRARTANPFIDILLVAPAENQRTNNPVAMSVYADALYEIARDERNVAYLDLQQWFGEKAADYASTSGRPWFASDLIHPDPDMGGYVIADAWLFAMRELSS
ncbi:SGNH/GDSL hydrolase family protein [Klebsiella pneumoniae]|uniref:SGNH/GDSL hydrolase family protein n=3 Tax=Klebsiella pneumoniae complex TaxID=3390273 RepID=UPI002B1BDE12|nr:GDSL-type esterase/lipase family protein [Klebsiella pneumoniae]